MRPCWLQIFCGSLAIVLGLCFGAGDLSDRDVVIILGSYEVLRLILTAAMIDKHRVENIAKP